MAKKHDPDTCWCKAYPFPHHVGGGKCKHRIPYKRTQRRADMMNARLKKARKRGRYLPRTQ